MVLAHVLITTPFAIRFVTVALSGVDPRIEQAAASLGATRLVVFRQVTLPLIRPGLVAALVFAFIISFDEVAASLFVASPDAMTLPVRIFVYVEQNYDPLVTAVSSLLVLAAMVALIVVERLIGVGRVFGLR
jgi:putative spermidine/putrescine transport system permease protein